MGKFLRLGLAMWWRNCILFTLVGDFKLARGGVAAVLGTEPLESNENRVGCLETRISVVKRGSNGHGRPWVTLPSEQ